MEQISDRYDVVVVGYGGAGASAAIAASDAGGRVLVLEKAAQGGGSTQIAGGNIRSVVDADAMVEHFYAICEGATDLASIEAHVHALQQLPEWVDSLGGVMAVDARGMTEQPPGPPYPREHPGSLFPGLPGAEGVGARYRWPLHDGLERGASAYAMLARNVASRGVDVATSAAVDRLVRDGVTGRVDGVLATIGGERVEIRADRGVVLACGGFTWDKDLLRDNIGAALPSASPPHRNTGDGVRMAQSVGAALWHMRAAVIQMGIVVPEFEASFSLKVRGEGFIIVDRTGRRFCDETSLAGHDGGILLQDRDMRSAMRKRLPAYLVFDEATRLAGPIIVPDRGFNRDSGWSLDNSMPVEKGWISSSPTIRGLAEQLGLDPAALSETVAGYNRDAPAGRDPFGRAAEASPPVEDGPFYGVPLWPCILNTQGGPRRDPRGRVIDPWGDPVPGLFGAGELGSIWHTLYPGGGNYGEALASGRVAGASALDVSS